MHPIRYDKRLLSTVHNRHLSIAVLRVPDNSQTIRSQGTLLLPSPAQEGTRVQIPAPPPFLVTVRKKESSRESADSLSLLPLDAGHDSPHELVKQGHCERSVAVTRTPDHTFDNQLTSDRPKRCDITAQLFGDVAGTVGPGTKLGHGAQIFLLQRGQTIEADAKEALIKRSSCG